MSTMSPNVANASDSHSPDAGAVMRRDAHRVQAVHEVRRDGADHTAGELRGQVDQNLAGGHASEDAVGERHRRVEMRPRHRTERQDQRHQTGTGDERVLQQFQADVVRQPLRSDARADDNRDETSGTEELRQRLTDKTSHPHGRFTAVASRAFDAR